MHEFAEPRVRHMVSEFLGVGEEELVPEVSLVDDLAADSLDLVELAIVLEGQFGIVFPEAMIDSLRTYGDLVESVATLSRGRRAAEAAADEASPPALVWACVIPPPVHGVGDHQLQRAGWLTPYTAQTIAEDALSAGRGSRLEMMVPPTMSDSGLAQLQDQFAWLGARGVQVSVRRDQHVGSLRRPAHPDAAA